MTPGYSFAPPTRQSPNLLQSTSSPTFWATIVKVSLALVRILLFLQKQSEALTHMQPLLVLKVEFPISPDSAEKLGNSILGKALWSKLSMWRRHSWLYTSSTAECWCLTLNGNNLLISLNCHLKSYGDWTWAFLYGIIIIQEQRLDFLILVCLLWILHL